MSPHCQFPVDAAARLAVASRPKCAVISALRPGRFDRTITVNPPDQKGRHEILKVHTRQVPLSPDVDIEQIARTTRA